MFAVIAKFNQLPWPIRHSNNRRESTALLKQIAFLGKAIKNIIESSTKSISLCCSEKIAT